MPADLPHVEGLLLRSVREARGAPAFIEGLLTPVLHEFSSRVRITVAAPGPAVALADQIPSIDDLPVDLDATERLGLAAYVERQSERFAVEKANRPLSRAGWGSAEGRAPDADEVIPGELTLAESQRFTVLRGRIAVGVILVGGPGPDLTLDEDAQVAAVAQIEHGLSWLGTINPTSNITWAYDIRPIEIDVPPDGTLYGYEPLEAHWRDPALVAMGYQPGFPGVDDYVADLVRDLETTSGFCAFITRYPTKHFAYASIGGPRIVQQYENGDWTSANIDRVFAHEACHIFGAPDEYGECDCEGVWGTSGAPNSNCVNCAEHGGDECIMRSNAWAMCPATQGHLGL